MNFKKTIFIATLAGVLLGCSSNSLTFSVNEEEGYFTIKEDKVTALLREADPDFMSVAEKKVSPDGYTYWEYHYNEGSALSVIPYFNKDGYLVQVLITANDGDLTDDQSVARNMYEILVGFTSNCTNITSPKEAVHQALEKENYDINGCHLTILDDSGKGEWIGTFVPSSVLDKLRSEAGYN